MGSLEMTGSFLLNDEAIDETLTRTSPGNYALGYMDGDAFVVFYVGRSDCDVRQRLHEWVDMPSRYARYASPAKAPWGAHRRGAFPMGAPAFAPVENAESGYTHFAFSYARTGDEAYAKEWRNYDDFGGGHGLDNEFAPTATGHPMNDPVTHAAAGSADPDGPHPRLMLLRRPPARCAP